jgi:hypothetical protein
MTDEELSIQHKQNLIATIIAPALADAFKITDPEERVDRVNRIIEHSVSVVESLMKVQ